MKNLAKLCVLLTVTVLSTQQGVTASEPEARLDVFHELLEKFHVSGDALPEEKVEEFFDNILHRFLCEMNGAALPGLEAETSLGICHENLVSTPETYRHVGPSQISGQRWAKRSIRLVYSLSLSLSH